MFRFDKRNRTEFLNHSAFPPHSAEGVLFHNFTVLFSAVTRKQVADADDGKARLPGLNFPFPLPRREGPLLQRLRELPERIDDVVRRAPGHRDPVVTQRLQEKRPIRERLSIHMHRRGVGERQRLFGCFLDDEFAPLQRETDAVASCLRESLLAAPVPPERVLLALLVSKAADVCPLHFSELVLEAGEHLVQAEDVVSPALARRGDVDANNAHRLGSQHNVVPFVADVVVEVRHAACLLASAVGVGDEGFLALGALDLDAPPAHAEAQLDALALQQAADQGPLLVGEEFETHHLVGLIGSEAAQ
mmetsp:Transcript_9406/g.23409  ORF Transcript_9406/g.23409 Transcript_9406/m.23409 type:complete len:304 (+) Transcript_9406:692-1603(+)